jgi:hypothetical protein
VRSRLQNLQTFFSCPSARFDCTLLKGQLLALPFFGNVELRFFIRFNSAFAVLKRQLAQPFLPAVLL